jgi:hypothetical protein
MNNPAVATPNGGQAMRTLSQSGYCEHAAARHIRVYMPYADANTLRLRAAQALGSPDAHVSWLYAIPGGWGWTICRDCHSRERKSA